MVTIFLLLALLFFCIFALVCTAGQFTSAAITSIRLRRGESVPNIGFQKNKAANKIGAVCMALLLCASTATAWAQAQGNWSENGDAATKPVALGIPQGVEEFNIKPYWESVKIPKEQAHTLHPQTIWEMPKSQFTPGNPSKKLSLHHTEAYFARFRLFPPVDAQTGEAGYLLVPSATVDAAYIWVRPEGGEWQRAVIGGDIFGRSDAVVRSSHVSVALPYHVRSVDVVVRIENHFNLFMRMLWQNSRSFYEGFFYSNRSMGANLGLAGAVLMFSIFAYYFIRRHEFLGIMALAVAIIFHFLAFSGAGRDLLWGNYPYFNEISIEFSSYIAAIAFAVTVWMMLGKRLVTANIKWLMRFVVYTGVALALLHAAWSYKSGIGNWLLLGYMVLMIAACLGASAAMFVFQKDRLASWVVVAVLLYAAFIVLISLSRYYLLSRDHFLTVSGMVFTLSSMFLFATAYSRHRFGHTAASEQMLFNQSSDPLTGLLDRSGLLRVMALQNLRTNKSSGNDIESPIMVVRLRDVQGNTTAVRGVGNATIEAAEIRLAYLLKNEFQNIYGGANIARMEPGVYALFLEKPMNSTALQQHATRIVTQLLSVDDLPSFRTVFGVQIVLDQVRTYELSMGALQEMLKHGDLHAEDPRVILWQGKA